MSTQAREQREMASTGANAFIGTPPTPMPTLAWTGMRATAMHGFMNVSARAMFQATVRLVLTLTAGPNTVAPARCTTSSWPGRLEPGEARAPIVEPPVGADHQLARHADHDAHVGVCRPQPLDGEQRREEVGVAAGAGGVEVDAVGAGLPQRRRDVHHVLHGQLDRLLLGGAGVADPHLRQQLRPVAARSVRGGVATEVGLGAVVDGDREALLRLLHRLPLDADHGLDRLVGVVDVVELAGVRGEALLVLQQGAHAAALLLRAGAVEAEDHFVADVDGAEARRAGEDVEEVLQLGRLERRQLASAGRRLGAFLELGAQLAARERHRRAVTEARDEPCFHAAYARGGPAGTQCRVLRQNFALAFPVAARSRRETATLTPGHIPS